MPRFLFFPNITKGMGGGHLIRTMHFVERIEDSVIVAPDNFIISEDATSRVPFLRYSQIQQKIKQSDFDNPIFVFDRRETDASIFSFVSENTYTIGVDEGGELRDEFHYLADITYDLVKPASGNIALSPFPETQNDVSDIVFPFRHVLITFGSEDAAGLTKIMVNALLDTGFLKPHAITVIEGPLFAKQRGNAFTWDDGIEVFHNVKNMSTMLPRFDCVFTHFGITAYEAAAQGLPVILLNPSKYHRYLSKKAGFLEIGVKKVEKAKLKEYLTNRYLFTEFRTQMITLKIKKKQQTLTRLLEDFQPEGKPLCPVCGGQDKKPLARFIDRTYFLCNTCGTVRMIRFMGQTSEYSKEYFFTDYKNQYGKTYLEDFDKIKQVGEKRLGIIIHHLRSLFIKKTNPYVLDIGCAYGPFCAVVKEIGWIPVGIDISRDAVDYAKNTLNIQAEMSDFEKDELPENIRNIQFDLVTMWYVIEHFINTKKILQKVYAQLIPGGMFAFSTPNSKGISGRKNIKQFYIQSPSDHFIVWSPASVKKSLALYGFRIKKIRITGHHPERFFSKNSRILKNSKIILGICRIISKIFGLGDTFEVYAVKKEVNKEN